jgi:hypothetical protein
MNIAHVVIDVMNAPASEGLDRLKALGTRKVPLLAKGGKFVFAENLENVAGFVGLKNTGHNPLPPDELYAKWTLVLRAAGRYIRQMPDACLDERAIPNRDRAIRLVCHHIFRIAEAFVESAAEGKEYWEWHAQQLPLDGTMLTSQEIVDYGERILTRLDEWWCSLNDRTGQQLVKTYMGIQPLHLLLERSAWHSAQHVRQLMSLLEQRGIKPDHPLTKADLTGLPLPERLWE